MNRLPRPGLLALIVVSCFLPAPLLARVISYAPVTDRTAIPAIQKRTNRHYALVELDGVYYGTGPTGGVPSSPFALGRLVIHDSKGEEEPRAVLPVGPQSAIFQMAAAWEDAEEVPWLLAYTDADPSGDNPRKDFRLLFSRDGGGSWSAVPFPQGSRVSAAFFGNLPDIGGPLARVRGANLLPGDRSTPFLLSLGDGGTRGGGILGVNADGSARLLVKAAIDPQGFQELLTLLGSDHDGTRFLFSGVPIVRGADGKEAPGARGVWLLDRDGTLRNLFALGPDYAFIEGWIAPDGSAYFDVDAFGARPPAPFTLPRALYFWKEGLLTEVARPLKDAPKYGLTLLAIPAADYAGAWVVQRGPGLPTVLSRHVPGSPLMEQWRDISGPEVEALHAATSDERLLVQVHRPRPQTDQRLFRDPALAVWRIGQAAPKAYDELFVVEQPDKGFVHLDVDRVAEGEPFVFDSGMSPVYTMGGGPSGGTGGGADVTQEWGVVRGSLRQRLVVPAVARTTGMFGSAWRTDLLLYNPDAELLLVVLRYQPTGAGSAAKESALTLLPHEIRTIADVLLSTFGLQNGSGALFVTPEFGRSMNATSRTYTLSSEGSFGMGVGAIDAFAASGPRFPLTFSGALQGSEFRTNLAATDLSGRGSEILVRLDGDSGSTARPELAFAAPAGGQVQLNGLAGWLGVPSYETGALAFHPQSGSAIPALFVIDNRTNDPTYYPPDLPATVLRTVPAIVHADGANGAKFRSDLFLVNTSDRLATVTLAAKLWSSPESESLVSFSLLPRESKLIRDVLGMAFGKTGVARLRYMATGAPGTPDGVRLTSRTYTVDPSGGTYGLLIPPLNSFQAAGPGEALEILGPVGDARFRTNLSLVELTAFADGTSARARVEIVNGRGDVVEAFEVNVPTAGGMQLDDLFPARGLGNGPEAALLRISPFGGMLGAYATMLDRGTNDPVYFPAQLAAR